MRATRTHGIDSVLVQIDPNEKGQHGQIILPFLKSEQDGRLAEPTTGIVISCTRPDLMQGDRIVFHHNALLDNHKVEDGTDSHIYSIAFSTVFFVVRGDVYLPLAPFAIVERLYYKERVSPGGIILDREPIQIMNRLLITAKNEHGDYGDGTDVKVGDVVVCYSKSDYTCYFKQHGNLTEVVRIRLDRDVMGIDVPMTEMYEKNQSKVFDMPVKTF